MRTKQTKIKTEVWYPKYVEIHFECDIKQAAGQRSQSRVIVNAGNPRKSLEVTVQSLIEGSELTATMLLPRPVPLEDQSRCEPRK